MAASEVAICNMALALVGDSANVASINPPEPTVQAEYCSLFYPTARDALLQAHSWDFTLRSEVAPALVSSPTPNWKYAYALPNGAQNVLAVLPPGANNPYVQISEYYAPSVVDPYMAQVGFVPTQFEMHTLSTGEVVICTNQELAEIRYSVRVTDVSKFSALFTTALSHLLASYLAGPMIGGKEGMRASREHLQMHTIYLAMAKEYDSRSRRISPAYVATSTAARL